MNDASLDALPTTRTPPALRALSPRMRAVVAAALLIFGVQLWLVTSGNYGTTFQIRTTLITLVALLVPPINRATRAAIAHVDRFAIARPWMLASVMGAIAVVYFYAVARWQGRPFIPRIHDEFQFLLQARFLANGVLWMPPHALADFFDTFYVLREPVYAPQSFAGWPLMMVPATWIGLPFWITPLIVAGLAITLTCRLITDALGGSAGVVAVMIACSISPMRNNALAAMASVPAMLMGLVAVLCYTRWRRAPTHVAWLIGIGAAVGWAGATRPMDGLCYAVPIGIAMLIDLWPGRALRRVLVTASLVLVGTLPFLTLQLVQNRGITGSFTQTPFQLYNSIDQPGFNYAVAEATAQQPRTTLPQKRKHYEEFVKPPLKQYRERSAMARLMSTIRDRWIFSGLPGDLVIVLLPAAFLMVGANRAWVLASTVGCFVIGYAGYPMPGGHYTAAIAAGSAAVLLLGVEGIARTAGRQREFVRAAALVTLGVFSISGSPPFNRYVLDEMGFPGDLAQVERTLATVPSNSIVLIIPDADRAFIEEPVYNLDVVWPDDARVIRAQDLGPRDPELYAYYAQRQPTRVVYRYDRVTDALTRLGVVAELAARAATMPTTGRPTTVP